MHELFLTSKSPRRKDILEEKYDLYRVYNIVRSHPECTFVFSAISNQKKDDDLQFYKKSINDFEEFCIKFLDHFIVEFLINYTY